MFSVKLMLAIITSCPSLTSTVFSEFPCDKCYGHRWDWHINNYIWNQFPTSPNCSQIKHLSPYSPCNIYGKEDALALMILSPDPLRHKPGLNPAASMNLQKACSDGTFLKSCMLIQVDPFFRIKCLCQSAATNYRQPCDDTIPTQGANGGEDGNLGYGYKISLGVPFCGSQSSKAGVFVISQYTQPDSIFTASSYNGTGMEASEARVDADSKTADMSRLAWSPVWEERYTAWLEVDLQQVYNIAAVYVQCPYNDPDTGYYHLEAQAKVLASGTWHHVDTWSFGTNGYLTGYLNTFLYNLHWLPDVEPARYWRILPKQYVGTPLLRVDFLHWYALYRVH